MWWKSERERDVERKTIVYRYMFVWMDIVSKDREREREEGRRRYEESSSFFFVNIKQVEQ